MHPRKERGLILFDHVLSVSLQGSRRIFDIKLIGLTLSIGTHILVYDLIFPWVIENIVFDEKVIEHPIFEESSIFIG